jgi:hypothetical protein
MVLSVSPPEVPPELTIDALFGARTQVIVPDVLDAAAAAAVRERLAFTRYALLDRGSYDIATPDEPALLARLAALAARTTGRTLAVTEARVLQLVPGDYVLAHHDRFHAGHPIELVLDLSATPVAGAEVHYRRRGQVVFRVPSAPGSLSIVERGPTMACNHTYVSKLRRERVVRLIVLLE